MPRVRNRRCGEAMRLRPFMRLNRRRPRLLRWNAGVHGARADSAPAPQLGGARNPAEAPDGSVHREGPLPANGVAIPFAPSRVLPLPFASNLM